VQFSDGLLLTLLLNSSITVGFYSQILYFWKKIF